MSTTERFRGLGDRPGPEISDPLLTHEIAREARGDYDLDANISSRLEIRGNSYYTEIYSVGILVEISNRQGVQRRGLVDEIDDVWTRSDERTFTADTNLKIEGEL